MQECSLIILQRQQGDLDTEQLNITGKVLTNNPDIYTLWNIRREILIEFRYVSCLFFFVNAMYS